MSTPTKEELLDSYNAKIDELEEQIADHTRALESRIVMSRREEVARNMMILWLEEEVEILKKKIEKLETE